MAAKAAKSASARLTMAVARASNAASRQRAKKSSTLARTAFTAARAAAVLAPRGAALPADHAAKAVQSAKNASTRAWSMPGAALRSATAPLVAMMSAMSCVIVASGADEAVMMPSPLNLVPAKIFAVSDASARAIMSPVLPRFFRICFAEAMTALPSGVASLNAVSAIESVSFRSSPVSFRWSDAHLMAARSSGTRMRPSPSVSMRASVFSSSSRPFTGQLSATQSF